MPRRYKSQWQWHQRCIFAAFTFAFFPLLWRIMPFILKRSSGAFSINSPKMTLHIHDLIALFWTLDLESYYSRWTSTMADSTIDESTFLGFLSLLFFHLFFSSMTMCSSETVAVFCGFTMVWTTTDVRESSCYDYDDHSTEIESKRLSYFLKSALAHAFFFTQQRTPHFRKLLLLLLLGHQPKLPLCDPFCLFENTGNFLELKTLVAEKCIECDERDSVVTIRSTMYPAAIVKSLSVCTWKKLQKPQICAQAVGIMYNTYGNFFVLAIVCTVFEKKKY